MNTAATALIRGGLVLVASGLAFGLLFGVVVDHEARQVAFDGYRTSIERAAAGDGRWQDTQKALDAHSITHRRATDVHTHATNMGLLLMLLGLVAPLVASPAAGLRWTVGGLLAAGAIYPAGLGLQFLGLRLTGEVVAAVGAMMAVLALMWFCRQLFRSIDELANQSQDD